jgi:acyl carrier protein
MENSNISAEERVVNVVHRMIDGRQPTRPVSLDGNLAEAGLTSLDSVRLVLQVENEFDIEIPVSELTLTNFRSISAISRLITRLLEET